MNTPAHQLGHLKFRTTDVSKMLSLMESWSLSDGQTDSTENRARSIAYLNPHVYNISCEHAQVARFLNQCDLVCVDGIGTALVLRARQRRRVPRIVALHLFDALLENLHAPASAVLVGVTASEVEQGARNINALNSGLRIVDTLSGFENNLRYEQFFAAHAAIRWVLIGAGSPRSECIAQLAMQRCHEAIVFHIGAGTIKVYAGTKRRAPAWMSSSGIEWIHRIIFEPHTRARYALGTVHFIRRLIRQ
ncbi:MAG: WecB/TagA/CpsF family glycosyltransferase [Granulosicoccus sp.]